MIFGNLIRELFERKGREGFANSTEEDKEKKPEFKYKKIQNLKATY